MLRLYFNNHGDLPWSIDQGTIETEQHYKLVLIDGSAAGYTVYELTADNVQEPKAYIRFPSAKLIQVNEHVYGPGAILIEAA